jgi:hypothetical protein
MKPKWEVRIEDGVLEDLLSRPMPALVETVLLDWCEGICRRLAETAGHPPDVFTVPTTRSFHLGTVFEDRLLGLYYHQRTRRRTWRTLWFWPQERCEIVVTWLAVLTRP